MSAPILPPGATHGKASRAPLDWRYVRQGLEGLHLRLRRLEANRTPRPLGLRDLQNAGPMAQALPGHAPVNDANSGLYIPSPVLATLGFSLLGDVFVGESPPHWSRYQTWIVGVAAVCGTFTAGAPLIFDVQVNGSTISSISLSGAAASGFFPVDPPYEIQAYTDIVTVYVAAVGQAGNANLNVQVELGSFVSQNPGPVPGRP